MRERDARPYMRQVAVNDPYAGVCNTGRQTTRRGIAYAEDARTGLDWLSTDPMVVDAYLADEMCGRMFTVGAYATLLDLTGETVTVECASAVPHPLPPEAHMRNIEAPSSSLWVQAVCRLKYAIDA